MNWVSSDTILFYVAACFLGWKLFWNIIHLFLGVYVSSVGFSNGLVLLGIMISTKNVNISLHKFRVRLWGSSKIILEDFEIEVKDLDTNIPRTKNSSKANTDNDIDLNISKIPVSKSLLKFLLKHIPRINVELRNTTLNYQKFASKIDTLTFLLNSRYNKLDNSVKINVDVRSLNITQSISEVGGNLLDLIRLSNTNMKYNFLIDLTSGELQDSSFQLFISGIRLLVLNVIKILLEKKKYSQEEIIETTSKKKKFSERLQSLAKATSYIKEISVHLEDADLIDIPFAASSDNVDFSTYMKKEKLNTCLNLNFKAATINFQKLIQSSAGYSIMFDTKKDIPFQFTSSIQLLNLNYVVLHHDGHETYIKSTDEILNIPNCSFTFKANFLHQLLDGYGFKGILVEFYSSASSPILDLDTLQLSELIYNVVLLKELLKLKEIKSIHEGANLQEVTKKPDSKNAIYSLKKGNDPKSFWNLLSEYYPHLDMKVVIEQPRAIIRHVSKTNTEILNFSYSLLNLQISTSEAGIYNTNCHILHPSISFEVFENANFDTRSKEEIFGIEAITLDVLVMKNLRLETNLEIKRPLLLVSNLDNMRGIYNILSAITNFSIDHLSRGVIYLTLTAEIIEKLKDCKNGHVQNSEVSKNIFTGLPHWILKASIKISNLTILFGSISVLIPTEFIHNENLLELNNLNLNTKLSFDSFLISLVNKEYDSGFENSSNSSQDTLTTVNQEIFWNLDCSLSKLNLSVKTNRTTNLQSIFTIPSINISTSALCVDSTNCLNTDLHIDQVHGSIDKFKIFTLIGTVYLMKEYVIFPGILIRQKIDNDLRHPSRHKNPASRNSIYNFFHLNCVLDDFQFIFHLSEDFKAKLQVFNTMLLFFENKLMISSNFVRLITDSSTIKGKWDRIACVDSLNFNMNDPNHNELIHLSFGNIRFIHPHKLVVYKLFDNLSIMLKIVKHLVKCLKSENKTHIVLPTEANPVKLPAIKLNVKKLSFTMEDDPFESELNMIFQLGLIEQKKRIELYSLWESKAATSDFKYDDVVALQKAIVRSWIRKVKSYKHELTQELHKSKDYLYGNEVYIERKNNKRVVPYNIYPPLLSVIMSDVVLNITTTQFNISDVPNFIHKMGQGVPIDTKYNLLVPMFIDLMVSELRMHLRDYPLPLLYIPKNKNSNSLLLSGHLVISEAFGVQKENLRELSVNLLNLQSHNLNKNYYTLKIQKSLAPVKMFFDLSANFNSNVANRFVWGQSYQFGLQQVLLNLDQFSKPPVDPSLKLGIWDKIRVIMHGKFSIHSDSKLEIAFKGSRSPYGLFDTSSGFVLSFSENVHWQINSNDDSRSFFDASSESVFWYIPNYLAAPMLTWSRPSSSLIYLPNSKKFISSCFAYYLDTSAVDTEMKYQDVLIEKNIIKLHGGVNFKVGFVLQRYTDKSKNTVTTDCKPHYLINLFNPEYTKADHDSYYGFRSNFIHMAITLVAGDESSYNSIHLSANAFLHFFNWWKLFTGNMQLPIRNGNLFGDKKQTTKFSQHLISNTFQFKIKSLFISHIYRGEDENNKIECIGVRGKMDNFMVDLHQKKEPRIEIHEELSRNKQIKKMNFGLGEVHLSGIDLRSVNVSFDKEEYTSHNSARTESSSNVHNNDKKWFDIEDYEDVALPTLSNSRRNVSINPLLFSEQFSYLREFVIDPKNLNMSSVIRLFEDAHVHDCSLQSKNVFAPQIELYESRISNLRDQVDSNNKKGKDTTQLKERISSLEKDILDTQAKWEKMIRRKSLIGSESALKDHFHNRFILIGMLLKWNARNRNAILKYIHFIQLIRTLRQYMSHESIATIEELISSAENFDLDDVSSIKRKSVKDSTVISNPSYFSSEDRLQNFDEIIHKVKSNEKIREDYRVEIISPQIQLQSELAPNSVVLISAPTIDMKIMSVVEKNKNDHLFIDAKELEVRFGVILKDASIFILKKEEVINSDNLLLSSSTYGAKKNWPPWLGIEICKNGALAGDRQLLVDKTSTMVTYDIVKPLAHKLASYNDSELVEEETDFNQAEDKVENIMQKLQVDIPKLIIKSTSEQYFALYLIIVDLLFYTEPTSKLLVEKLEKLRLSLDLQDLISLHERVAFLRKYHYLLKNLLCNYNFRKDFLDNEQFNDYSMLVSESKSNDIDIYLLMQSILTGNLYLENNNSSSKSLWFIRADEIILHMLEDDRKPILDLAIANGTFKRIISDDGSNENRIDVHMMQGFNLIPGSYYQSIIEPHCEKEAMDAKESLIIVDWTMKRSIGGIKIMENFEIQSKPLNIRIDEITGEKLMKFIFRTDSFDEVNDSPVAKIVKSQKNESDESGESEKSADSSGTRLFLDEHSSKLSLSTSQDVIISGGSANKDSNHSDYNSNGKLKTKNSQSFYSDFSGSEYEENIELMLDRANKYMTIIALKIRKISLKISIKLNKGIKRLMNVQDFLVHLPEVNIENRFMSFLDIAMILKKMIIKSLLNHSGRLLQNKLTNHKHRRNFRSIKPLEKYDKFINATDLESVQN